MCALATLIGKTYRSVSIHFLCQQQQKASVCCWVIMYYIASHNASTLSPAAGWMSFGIKDHLLCALLLAASNANLLK